MHLSTVYEWTEWLFSQPRPEMVLGLDRVRSVAEKLALLPIEIPVITVAGTNGKGTTVGALEAIYREAGYHVGAFTSPILFSYNEYIRLDGCIVSDEQLITAFQQIEAARQTTWLTPFEFFTLAALLVFKKNKLDLLLLEVGLGGRLDAVNIVDADIGIVTSIDLDHTEWLGPTRDLIAIEKAGILRSHQPAICGDVFPPETLLTYTQNHDIPLFIQNQQFGFSKTSVSTWAWHCDQQTYTHLPMVPYDLPNLSTALMAVTLLQSQRPVAEESIRRGLTTLRLLGRFQVVTEPMHMILDVAHNPAAIRLFAQKIQALPCPGKTYALFSMLADKDIKASIAAIRATIDHWLIAPIPLPRGLSEAALATLAKEEALAATVFHSLSEAFDFAKQKVQKEDRILVFGSFHTVAAILKMINF